MRRLLPLVLLAAAPLPGVGPGDRRVVVSPRIAPWSSLVRLQVPGVARCTGVLVGPSTVLTAAHCLWSARLNRFVPPDMIHVLTRYVREYFAGHALATGYRIAPGNDVAVLTLTAPIGKAVLGFAALPAAGTPAMLGGYNQDRAEVMEADTHCRVIGSDDGLIRHDCAGTRGTSGAPLLVRGAGGAWRIAGIQVRAIAGESGGIAVGAATLQALLAADGGTK